MTRLAACSLALTLALAAHPLAQAPAGANAAPPDALDLLTFAQGAVPVRIEGAGAAAGTGFEQAVRLIDGNPQGFTLTRTPLPGDATTVFVYALPSPTTFERFAVPNVLETPAPAQTFSRHIAIRGSAESATSGFVPLAEVTLQTHRTRGLVTTVAASTRQPVRWLELRLTGGIDVQRPAMFFEFSEIQGYGQQDTAPPVDHFTGGWRSRALRLQLRQQGALVSGCYDGSGVLQGTVTGNILRATGIDRSDTTPSAFVLSVAADGSIRGVRSDNGAPFRYYTVPPAAGAAPDCPEPAPPALGCGSIIHGITFDVDSAAIRPDSQPLLAELFRGLAAESRRAVIEGHTSSEGTDDYNLKLSERRAQAVMADLITRGLHAARLTAVGVGERRPIARNDDESGRAINRRVEIRCE